MRLKDKLLSYIDTLMADRAASILAGRCQAMDEYLASVKLREEMLKVRSKIEEIFQEDDDE
jgi:hypothetical protein